MSNTAKKARKRAHQANGYGPETAFEPEPKRRTHAYRTHREEQAKRRREREVAEMQMAAIRKITAVRRVTGQ